MRIKPAHYQALRAAMLQVIDEKVYHKYQDAGYTTRRYLWDCLRNPTLKIVWNGHEYDGIIFTVDVLYEYMEDRHVNSALCKILREVIKNPISLNNPWFS